MSRISLDTNIFIYLLEDDGPRGVRVLPFDDAAGERYARVRQERGIKAPDAIQLATAAVAGCDLFITSDDRLTRVRVAGIHFIASMERAPI